MHINSKRRLSTKPKRHLKSFLVFSNEATSLVTYDGYTAGCACVAESTPAVKSTAHQEHVRFTLSHHRYPTLLLREKNALLGSIV